MRLHEASWSYIWLHKVVGWLVHLNDFDLASAFSLMTLYKYVFRASSSMLQNWNFVLSKLPSVSVFLGAHRLSTAKWFPRPKNGRMSSHIIAAGSDQMNHDRFWSESCHLQGKSDQIGMSVHVWCHGLSAMFVRTHESREHSQKQSTSPLVLKHASRVSGLKQASLGILPLGLFDSLMQKIHSARFGSSRLLPKIVPHACIFGHPHTLCQVWLQPPS